MCVVLSSVCDFGQLFKAAIRPIVNLK